MANISETLRIQDQFSSVFERFSSIGERVSQTLDKINNRLDENGNKQEQAAKKTDTHNNAAKRCTASVDGLAASVGKLVAVIGGLATIRAFVGLSDQITQTQARLNAIKGEYADVAELNDAIFAAAQRSRGSYLDMASSVASLKAQTGDVFASTAEAVRFTELLNKQFTISGTSASGVASTMYNLTQALATGVLRGNDLQMVLSNSPALIQKISDYMGVTIGEIREMAQDGKITADIVKNAIMGAGEEIDAEFEKMPMTFGQAVQKLKNEGIRAIEPLRQAFSNFVNSEAFENMMATISTGIEVLATIATEAFNGIAAAVDWASQNTDILINALGIVGGAYLALQAVSVGSALASAAAWAVAHWPILLLGAVLGMVAANAISMGMTFQEVGTFVGQVFGFIYAVGYNAFAGLWNVIASFAEFFANVWNDPLGATVRLFQSVFDSILGMVEATANAIDALLGSNLSGAVAGFRGKLAGWVSDKFGDNAVQIQRMANIDTAETMASFGEIGGNLGGKIDKLGGSVEGLTNSLGDLGDFEVPDYSGAGAGGSGKKANVGTVDKVKEAKLSDEDVKLYRDLAERRYMANVELQTLAPSISVSIPESAAKNLTSEDVANKLKVMLIQQAAAHTSVAHAH